MAAIQAACAGLPVTIIDRTIDRAKVNSLIRACDCLISLHRSEGFGLTLAEAMFLQKPVIATGYSGNLDFMRPDNAFLVEYDLTRVPCGCDPYDEGELWAEPRLDHAVQQMQLVMENAEIRAARAGKGGEFVRMHLAPQVIGRLMRERLELLAGQRMALSGELARQGRGDVRSLPLAERGWAALSRAKALDEFRQ
jgi:glycosyltransferase involved in cell wall biosynthesis